VDRKLRVAFVTQWFPPEPVLLPQWIAESLQRRDVEIEVITGIPNYPSGRVMPGYRANRRYRENIDGIWVNRVPLFPSHSSSAVLRMTNYGSFAASATLNARATIKTCDVALVYGSPVTAAIPVTGLGLPYVVMAMDLWPDSIYATGYLASGSSRKFVEGTVGKVFNHLYSRASAVTVPSPTMKSTLTARGMNPASVHTVYNWVDEGVFKPGPSSGNLRSECDLTAEDFVILYAGTIGPAQGLRTVIEAVQSLPKERRVHLVIMGEGIEKADLAKSVIGGMDCPIHILDARPATDVVEFIRDADLNLVSLLDDPLFRMTVPSKMAAVMASGGPVLTVVSGDATDITLEAQAGFVATPGSVTGVARAIELALATPRHEREQMGASGRRFYESVMSETINADKLANLLCDLRRPRERNFPSKGLV
jgi:colanic acid biosynthesis glycosyl transferase WcaI